MTKDNNEVALFRGVSGSELKKIQKNNKLVIDPKFISDGSGSLSFTDDINKAKNYSNKIVVVKANKVPVTKYDYGQFKENVSVHDSLGDGKFTYKVGENLPVVDIQNYNKKSGILERYRGRK
jgi:hypothetical protein